MTTDEFEELVQDVSREAQEVALANEWGANKMTAEIALNAARRKLIDAYTALIRERDEMRAQLAKLAPVNKADPEIYPASVVGSGDTYEYAPTFYEDYVQ